MKTIAASALVIGAAVASKLQAEGPMRFDNDKVVRVHLSDRSQVAFVERLHEVLAQDFDFWKLPVAEGYADIHTSEMGVEVLENIFTAQGMDWEVIVDDVQALLDKETFGNARPLSEDWYTEYHTHDQNLGWIDTIYDTYNGVNGVQIEVFSVGRSYEGRDLRGLRFTAATTAQPCRYTFVYNGHQHAREWLTTPVVQYVTENLLKDHANNSTVLDTSCFHVLPTVNPDGYEFSRNSNRMWRKSRKPNQGSNAVGTDLNRNWPYQWGGSGASTNPSSDTYRGVTPEDNVEVHEWMNYIRSIVNLGGRWADRDGIEFYADFHTYGNYILLPWGYTATRPVDYDCQICVGYGTRDAIATVNGNRYLTGPSGPTLYTTSGSAPDTAYGPPTDNTNNPNTGFQSVLHAWTFELSAGQGFTWPADRILEICYELWAGYEWFIQEIHSDYSSCAACR